MAAAQCPLAPPTNSTSSGSPTVSGQESILRRGVCTLGKSFEVTQTASRVLPSGTCCDRSPLACGGRCSVLRHETHRCRCARAGADGWLFRVWRSCAVRLCTREQRRQEGFCFKSDVAWGGEDGVRKGASQAGEASGDGEISQSACPVWRHGHLAVRQPFRQGLVGEGRERVRACPCGDQLGSGFRSACSPGG